MNKIACAASPPQPGRCPMAKNFSQSSEVSKGRGIGLDDPLAVVRWLRARRERARTRRALKGLDDRLLADIGLRRSDVDSFDIFQN